MVGANCSRAREAAEVGAGARLDRTCERAYGQNEDPAVPDTPNAWNADHFTRWLHALHYRDLYQQKLAYVRGYLGASGADRLQEYDKRAFLVPTHHAGMYYDEGAAGRCIAQILKACISDLQAPTTNVRPMPGVLRTIHTTG